MSLRRICVALAVAPVWLALMAQAARAQDYPARPVTIVVPTGPGEIGRAHV